MTKFKKYKLRDLVEKDRGISYGVVQPGTFLKVGIPLIRVNNLTENKLSIHDVKKIDTSIEAKYSRTRLKGTELLVSLVGSLGHIGYVKCHMIGWNVARAIGVLPIKEEYDRDWIYWHLKSTDVQGALYNSATTSVQATINLKELQEIEINYPNEEYRKMATSILSSLDDKIELNRRTNHTLEQLAQTLFKKYFVDDIDPENLPEGWRWGVLSDIIEFSNGNAFSSRDLLNFDNGNCYHVFKMGNIKRGGGFNSESTKSYFKKDKSEGLEKYILRRGDLSMCMTDMKDSMALLGHTALMNESEKYIVNQRVGLLRPNNNLNINYPFLFLLTNSPAFIDDLRSRANSGVQVNLSTSEIKNSRVIIPKKTLNKEFNNIVEPLYANIFSLTKQNESLTAIRDSLLPKLLSGEIEVNVAEKELAEL